MTTLYVDADACPVKDEVYRVAARYALPVIVVSNSWIRVPREPRIKLVVWDYNVIDAAILDSVSSSGWGNSVYGAVTPAEHRVCMELGLAGLITDHPSLVREARA